MIARSLSSWWLTADCVTPSDWAAPVMLPASTTADKQSQQSGVEV